MTRRKSSNKMVRLKDIAARAGVSIMTVSKAMRNARDISEPTKERVRAVAQQMGYVPDALAQGLRSGATRLLGLVISSMSNPIFARTVTAIEERAFELGYDLLLAHSLNLPAREEASIKRLLSRRVDGLFLFPVYRLAPVASIYEEIKRQGTPTVILGHKAPFCQTFVSVETDDLMASYHATRYLLGLGHRRVAYFHGPAANPSAVERLEGYRRAHREMEIELDDSLVFNAGSSLEEGEKAALQYLNEMPRATAVQTYNDLVAIGAAGLFINQGMRIPQDISIVGFGNILTSEHYRVPLTTIRQPKFRLGLAAMDSMIKLLRRDPAESRRLPAELIIRASSGPPAGGG
jgi:LacI family transcriptional regulator